MESGSRMVSLLAAIASDRIGARVETHMASIENVGGTAFVVAEFRADENAEPAPLYRDPVVGFFLNEDTKRAAGRVAARFPQVRDLVRIRTKYLDDMLDGHLMAQVRQVLILGAGLDTRAVRKRRAGVTYFEIDEAATLQVKQACYRQQGFDVDVRFIPGNYVTEGLAGLLAHTDFDPSLPTYVIWEGNTMYLPLAAARHLLTELRGMLRQFRVSFDYMAEAVIANTTGDAGITRLVESFASMGAPWLSGFADVRTLARDLGLTLVENVRTADLHRAYWSGRPMDSPIFEFYSLCTLGN
jgi:methyltransferase (TIGR00027 family)